MPPGLGPFALSALEAQPPFAFEAAEESAPLIEGGGDVGVARMDQGPGSLAPEPAVPVRKLLNMARVQAPAHSRCPVPPGVGEESLQHAVERAVAGRDLDDFTHL